MKELCKFIVVFIGILTALSILSTKNKKEIINEKPRYYLSEGKKISGSTMIKKKFIKNNNYKKNDNVKPENDIPDEINKKDTYKNISNNTVNFNNSSPSPV